MAFVKLDREIIDSEIFFDDKLLAFYVRLLLMTRVRSCYEKGIFVGKGQLFTSVRKLGQVFNASNGKILRILNSLEEKKLIKTEVFLEGSLITVLAQQVENSNLILNSNENENPTEIKLEGVPKNNVKTEHQTEHQRNADGTPTLLYKKNEKNDEKSARLPQQNRDFSEDFFSEEFEDHAALDQKNSSDSEKNSAKITEPVITRGSLVEKYGEKNVADYELRYERWKLRQDKPVRIGCCEAIERWMQQDKVEKPHFDTEAGYDLDAIMKHVYENYTD